MKPKFYRKTVNLKIAFEKINWMKNFNFHTTTTATSLYLWLFNIFFFLRYQPPITPMFLRDPKKCVRVCTCAQTQKKVFFKLARRKNRICCRVVRNSDVHVNIVITQASRILDLREHKNCNWCVCWWGENHHAKPTPSKTKRLFWSRRVRGMRFIQGYLLLFSYERVISNWHWQYWPSLMRWSSIFYSSHSRAGLKTKRSNEPFQ